MMYDENERNPPLKGGGPLFPSGESAPKKEDLSPKGGDASFQNTDAVNDGPPPEKKYPLPPPQKGTVNKTWLAAGILLVVIYVTAYAVMDRVTERAISRIDKSNFGIVWNHFEGQARTLLYLAKMALTSLDYEIMKSEYDADDRMSTVWARYRHAPKKNYPPFIKIRVQEKTDGTLVLFYQGDKEYLSVKNPVLLPEPFYEKLYAYVRSGEHQVKETIQSDDRTPYYRPPEKVRGIKP